MASAPVPRDRGDFETAILCALSLEAEYVIHALDRVWKDKKYDPLSNDDSAYTLGAIGRHNVVIVHMPGMGTMRATSAAKNLTFSYPGVKLALVVGICGGMPKGVEDEEILLGDVVISKALIPYDFGAQYPQGFKRKGDELNTLGPPSEKILGLLNKLEVRQNREDIQSKTYTLLQAIQQRSLTAQYPGAEHDVLFKSSYNHQHRKPGQCHSCEKTDEICETAIKTTCEDLGCESQMRVSRQRLHNPRESHPVIHFGKMGCANTVMKSGHHRDILAQKEEVIALEMEGAGVWTHGPSIVIKGVCDYADSHKRKCWQRYAAATAAACTRAFLLDWWIPGRRENSSQEGLENVYFDVPEKQKVKKFYGREDELTKIATYFDHLNSESKSDQPRILVLHAMGGQGKTQIALEYCFRARKTRGGIFWVNGSSVLAMTRSLAGVAQQLDRSACEMLFDDDDDAKAKLAIRLLNHWEHRWLIVFDNCDDATTFLELEAKFLPQVGKGDILFTSRHRGLEELGEIIEVPPMPPATGVKLLLHRYRDVKIDKYLVEGTEIVNRLGNLALAIDQASAFMHYTHLSIDNLSKFLPSFLAQRTKVLQHTAQYFWKYSKLDNQKDRETAISAFTTWEMSFRQLLERAPNSDNISHFFTLSAFLGQTPINEAIFRFYWERSEARPSWMANFTSISPAAANREDSETLREDVTTSAHIRPERSQVLDQSRHDDLRESWAAEKFWHTLHQAYQISLLQSILPGTEVDEVTFTFHPLIRDWLQLRVTLDERQMYTREATSILTKSIQVYSTKISNAQIKTALLLHVDAVLLCDDEFFREGHRLGQHISTCGDAHWIAAFYRDQGRYSASFNLFSREVTTSKRALGTEHRDTLISMSSLASALSDQGKYGEAERIHLQVLEVTERVLGKEHPDTLISMSNLASTLSDQGKYSEAERIHRQVLEVRERVLGTEHPSILNSMNNLALALWDQGKYSEAERINRQVLEVRERVLGTEHPDTLKNMNNLALALRNQGKYSEAERIYRQVLKVRERVLGTEHPDTLNSISNLALALRNQGKYGEAERIYRQVLKVRERVLGKEHPNTLNSMNNLASALSDQGEYRDAESIQLQTVKASLLVRGWQHPRTEIYLANLRHIWERQDFEEFKITSMVQDLLKDADDRQLESSDG